ncbi:5-dehydro-4-deoxyglucarate dehydratase [Nostocoides sp. HKS02]|uniref:5-dehydro-4-deoxyglucarate dehydratase n=1 Tax=Nostocoides sp. HKS02 TaxID=1813880 RepID=UPI0021046F36|nr:5-dehydro-4-deoxyglucarate dehydratase [Tetrasphaera sp. HKS02]
MLTGTCDPPGSIGERATAFSLRLRQRAQDGVMSFPLTPFSDDGSAIRPDAFRKHVRRQIDAGAAALFPCCGTGEFFSLTEDEYSTLVGIAVDEAAGEVPVIAGTGYGWASAARFAERATEAGVDGLLLLPHYLVRAPQSGLVAHVRQVADRTELPVVVYQREQVWYSASALQELASVPNVIGLKDGHSDLDQLQRLRLVMPESFLMFNGAQTAEMQARQYASIGIGAYSSAVHGFAPEIATTFFRSLRDGDTERVELLLREFYLPFVELRDRQVGYAVALVKAGARLRGEDMGPVRAPLADPAAGDLNDFEALMRSALAIVGAEL